MPAGEIEPMERHLNSRDLYGERRSAALAGWEAVMG